MLTCFRSLTRLVLEAGLGLGVFRAVFGEGELELWSSVLSCFGVFT